jgi:hypothetical protein
VKRGRLERVHWIETPTSLVHDEHVLQCEHRAADLQQLAPAYVECQPVLDFEPSDHGVSHVTRLVVGAPARVAARSLASRWLSLFARLDSYRIAVHDAPPMDRAIQEPTALDVVSLLDAERVRR